MSPAPQTEPAPRKRRDREATREKILAAARTLLEREGLRAFGVNAVAREAGVDKQLVYRYFGSLDGLVDRLAEDQPLWLGAGDEGAAAPKSYGDGVALLMRAYLGEIRRNAAARSVLAWELVDAGAPVKILSAARARAVGKWLASYRGRTGAAPKGVDAPAVNALLLAAIHHLALSEAASGMFAGMDLRKPDNWARLEKALIRVTALLDQPENDSRP